MPNLSPLSLKLIFISTSVLSAALALKLSVPAITDFAVSEVPSIYNGVVSWLRPPYLYLVINCIIITLVASSKLQSKRNDHDVTHSTEAHVAMHLPVINLPPVVPVSDPPHVQLEPLPHELDARGSDVGFSTDEPQPPQAIHFEYSSSFNELNHFEDKSLESNDKDEFITATDTPVAAPVPEAKTNAFKDQFVISKSSWSPSTLSRRDSSEFPVSSEKPPISARFGHRRASKASPEATRLQCKNCGLVVCGRRSVVGVESRGDPGGKTTLGVSKPKRQDTLENTWKTITEGRAMPLTRHLRKSDTWEMHGGRLGHVAPQNPKTVAKSETFTDGIGSRNNNNYNSRLSRSPGSSSGKLKREPSPSQDELNRRVEAFIKKFNEEMRLQRQESLNQYLEMINRGAQ